MGKRGQSTSRVATAQGFSIDAFDRMSDDEKVAELDKIFHNTKIDDDQNDNAPFATQVANATGVSANKPDIVATAREVSSYMARNGIPLNKIMVHSDAEYGAVRDAKVFADQYQGAGRHYLSDGIYGVGTYWQTMGKYHPTLGALSDNNYQGYGGGKSGYQMVGVIKPGTKRISQDLLENMYNSWASKYPRAAVRLNMHSSGQTDRLSAFALLKGYQVIDTHRADYKVVLDRSATLVAKKGHHGSSIQYRHPSYKNPFDVDIR